MNRLFLNKKLHTYEQKTIKEQTKNKNKRTQIWT